MSIPGSTITPRIIIHGGAGNLTKQSLPREKYSQYEASMSGILSKAYGKLSQPGATALDVAEYAVSLLEYDPLYNSGKGAVFNREGKNELECSIMVSTGYRKRGVGCSMLQHVKSPIKLAKALLVRGEYDGGEGSQDHCHYSGASAEALAKKWGLEMVDSSYFFTQQRWDEHKRGLEEEQKRRKSFKSGQINAAEQMLSDWEMENYIPLGTCGAVVLDSFGTICVATSTGGLTNKVPGRIGDTPTLGAGFWAEHWCADTTSPEERRFIPLDILTQQNFSWLLRDCFPLGTGYERLTNLSDSESCSASHYHAVGMSGTGNGDSFLRLAACRTAAAKSRFAMAPLAETLPWMAGRNGELQKSAGGRWKRSHEGTGGIIGIELVGQKGSIVWDYNCGGMFRAWVDDHGEYQCRIFREGYDSGPENWAST